MINFRYFKMARGQQKIQAQQKANEKAAKLKKAAGNNVHDNKKVMDSDRKWTGTGTSLLDREEYICYEFYFKIT